tara:strand:+ start:3861 stop:4196 length:336 start_codon:yes stop_codon:yes gene_type:complete
MAISLLLTFEKPVNKSLQIGDIIYYAVITNNVTGTPIEVGSVTALTDTTVTCNISSDDDVPSASNFFFFSKDNKANLSSLVGYYAEVEMKNESTSEVELYQVGSQISESSK